MGYTNKETLEHIQSFIRELFKSNTVLDNISYALMTNLGFPILSDNIHHKIAHAYGAQSDIITDFLDLRNDRIYRGNEIVEPKEYNNVLECLSEIIVVQDRLEGMVKDCILIAAENLDIALEDKLRTYYCETLVLYTKQAHKLYNMALKYSEEGFLPLFDEKCTEYFIV